MIRRLETAGAGVAGVIRALERPPGAVDPQIASRVTEILTAVRSVGGRSSRSTRDQLASGSGRACAAIADDTTT